MALVDMAFAKALGSSPPQTLTLGAPSSLTASVDLAAPVQDVLAPEQPVQPERSGPEDAGAPGGGVAESAGADAVAGEALLRRAFEPEVVDAESLDAREASFSLVETGSSSGTPCWSSRGPLRGAAESSDLEGGHLTDTATDMATDVGTDVAVENATQMIASAMIEGTDVLIEETTLTIASAVIDGLAQAAPAFASSAEQDTCAAEVAAHGELPSVRCGAGTAEATGGPNAALSAVFAEMEFAVAQVAGTQGRATAECCQAAAAAAAAVATPPGEEAVYALGICHPSSCHETSSVSTEALDTGAPTSPSPNSHWNRSRLELSSSFEGMRQVLADRTTPKSGRSASASSVADVVGPSSTPSEVSAQVCAGDALRRLKQAIFDPSA